MILRTHFLQSVVQQQHFFLNNKHYAEISKQQLIISNIEVACVITEVVLNLIFLLLQVDTIFDMLSLFYYFYQMDILGQANFLRIMLKQKLNKRSFDFIFVKLLGINLEDTW